MQRHFTWHRNILFAHELQESGADSLVILSAADKIVPSNAVRSHIEKFNQKIGAENSLVHSLYLEGAPHGGVIFEEKYQQQAIHEISELVAVADAKAKAMRSYIKPRSYNLNRKPALHSASTMSRH